MGAGLARHDALPREAVERHDGAVFATGGEAFCAAFHTASAALSAVRIAQLALAGETWPDPVRIRVRMALHTGTAGICDNDYFGQPQPAGIATMLIDPGNIASEQGDYASAQTPCEESLAIRRKLGNRRGSVWVLEELAYAASGMEAFGRAMTLERAIDYALHENARDT